MITIYGIKNCDSVKKAFHFFNEHSLEYAFIDFKISPVDKDKIVQWSQKGSLPLLLNTKGTTYRTLGLKSLSLNESEKVEWMAKENLLIKRPVIEYGTNVIIGFNPTQYEGIFLS
jgi:Spx/MgsR family transcriptional regulator